MGEDQPVELLFEIQGVYTVPGCRVAITDRELSRQIAGNGSIVRGSFSNIYLIQYCSYSVVAVCISLTQ